MLRTRTAFSGWSSSSAMSGEGGCSKTPLPVSWARASSCQKTSSIGAARRARAPFRRRRRRARRPHYGDDTTTRGEVDGIVASDIELALVPCQSEPAAYDEIRLVDGPVVLVALARPILGLERPDVRLLTRIHPADPEKEIRAEALPSDEACDAHLRRSLVGRDDRDRRERNDLWTRALHHRDPFAAVASRSRAAGRAAVQHLWTLGSSHSSQDDVGKMSAMVSKRGVVVFS